MHKRIVIALGGNALGNNLPEQMIAVKDTAKAIADLIEEGHEVVISHGNGPQVGMINLAMGELAKADPENPVAPLSVCVAMSQGYVGYDLQNALREELLDRGINKPVSSIITQMRVDEKDEAFKNPSKPIGRFMTREEADVMVAERNYDIVEDSGRGYRRVVASPKPVEIIEIDTVRALIDAGQVVIAAGGGGIPVYAQGNHLKGAAAVVDKDFGSCLLAKSIDADCLIILTAVEKVAINFGKDNEEWLAELTPADVHRYIKEEQFATGSMLPKVEAALDFAESAPERFSLITLLEKARDGIQGKTGTIIK
ncbi:MAG: carbamate kinase [Eubacterium sp.]